MKWNKTLVLIVSFDLIVSRKQAAALQSSFAASAKCSEEWELTLNPSESEHLPYEDTSNQKHSLFRR